MEVLEAQSTSLRELKINYCRLMPPQHGEHPKAHYQCFVNRTSKFI
jgi:hypothetical protein